VLEEARSINLLRGICITKGVEVINHSQHIAMGKVLISIARKFRAILDNYLNALGNKLNKEKCKLYGWSTHSGTLGQLPRALDFSLEPN
jgi:hypothetical protein